MIKTLLPFVPSARNVCRFTALLGLIGLTALPSARASVPTITPSTVVAGDKFGIELVAYNTTNPSGNFYAIDNTLMPTFGTTASYTNSALPLTPGGTNYQTLTVTSSESFNAGVFTDTITISVPTNFVPAGTLDRNGNLINALDFSIGLVVNTGGTNPLDFTTPINLLSVTGAVTYSGGSVGLTQNPVLTNGNKSFSNEEAVQSVNTTTPISSYNITGLSVTITYTAVPEPSTYAAVLLGVAGLGWMMVVRRRRA